MWNLEKWHWWTYLWAGSRDTDMENTLVDTVGEGESGTNQERSIETYVHDKICKIDSQGEFVVWCRELKLVLCDNPEG